MTLIPCLRFPNFDLVLANGDKRSGGTGMRGLLPVCATSADIVGMT
jgi:hypothetical protein